MTPVEKLLVEYWSDINNMEWYALERKWIPLLDEVGLEMNKETLEAARSAYCKARSEAVQKWIAEREPKDEHRTYWI